MSKKKRLIGLLCITVLCSQGLCAQTRQMGIEELFRLADEQSKSIQTYRTGKEAAEEALKAAKAQRLPDVNVSLSASYWGNGKLWDRDFSNGMTIDMPHFGNNFALEAQQVIYVQGGYVNFLTAFTDLRTQENSVRLADENYHVTDNRYKNEMALLTDMLDASNTKLTADLGLVDARINILYNYYKMKYITHTL